MRIFKGCCEYNEGFGFLMFEVEVLFEIKIDYFYFRSAFQSQNFSFPRCAFKVKLFFNRVYTFED